MIGQRLTLAAGVVVLVGCGGSELRRAMNDILNQREAGAAEQAELYESFEAELAEELMTAWGATPDDGCPELETLPSVPARGFSGFTGQTSARDRERERARQEALRARAAAWVRNVPAEQCRCLQKTIVNVRSAVARLASFPFEDERERLAEMTDEELPLAAPLLRGSEDQFSPDQARERVGGWKSRRDGEDGKLGWQSAAERVDSAFGLMGSIIFGSCDRF